MTRTELKQLTELCTCGHPATDHKFTRIAGGCTHSGNCSCIAYRTFDVRVPTGADLARELEHWAHHIGNPPGTPQMTAEQCNKAYKREMAQRERDSRREQYRQRRRELKCEIDEANNNLAKLRDSYRAEMREHKRKIRAAHAQLREQYQRLAAIPDVKEPASVQRLAA